jgi:hypothetical protein
MLSNYRWSFINWKRSSTENVHISGSRSLNIQEILGAVWWTMRFVLIPTRLICDPKWDAAVGLWRSDSGVRVTPLMMTTLVRNDGDERHSFVRYASWVRCQDGDKLFEFWRCLFSATPPLTPCTIRQEITTPRLSYRPVFLTSNYTADR